MFKRLANSDTIYIKYVFRDKTINNDILDLVRVNIVY